MMKDVDLLFEAVVNMSELKASQSNKDASLFSVFESLQNFKKSSPKSCQQ
jgi:hypothetical protein